MACFSHVVVFVHFCNCRGGPTELWSALPVVVDPRLPPGVDPGPLAPARAVRADGSAAGLNSTLSALRSLTVYSQPETQTL